MAKKNYVPKPIQWSEGLLLYPQHFQQNRRFWQQSLQYYMEGANPFFWGVHHCVFDHSGLSSFTVTVSEIQAVMPDGTIVEVTEQSPLSLNLEESKDLLFEPTKIYICTPREHEASANPKDEVPRYDVLLGDRHYHVDENTGENAVLVPKMAPILSLYVGENAIPARYASLPLCEVVIKDGVLSFTDFHYPTSSLTPEIVNVVRKEIMEIRRYAVYFVERLRSPLAFEGNALLDRYRKIYEALVSPLYLLEGLIQNMATHPYELYKGLCQAVGLLMSVGEPQMPPRAEVYLHEDIAGTLSGVLERIRERLGSLEKPSMTIPFFLESGVFFLKLEDRWLESGSFVLSIYPDRSEEEDAVRSWLEGALIISKSQVPQSQMRRVLGAKREFIEQDESLGLVYLPGRILMRVFVDSHCVQASEELCIVNLSRVHTPPHNIYICLRE